MKVQSIKLLNTNNNNLTSGNKQSINQSIIIKSSYSDMNLNSNPNAIYAKSSISFGNTLNSELSEMIYNTLTRQEVKNIPENSQPLLSELQYFVKNIRGLGYFMLPNEIVNFANEIAASYNAPNGVEKTIHQVKLLQKWAGCEPKDVPENLKPLFNEFGNLISKVDPKRRELHFMKEFIPTLLESCNTDGGRKGAILAVQIMEKWAGTEALNVAEQNRPVYNLLGKCFKMFGGTLENLEWYRNQYNSLLSSLPSD